jgi:predicted AAA+ superfamily ATPase
MTKNKIEKIFGKEKFKPVRSETGRVTVDYSYSQAEIRWIEEMKNRSLNGPEASGKTTLLADAIVRILEAGGCVAVLDLEHSLDPEFLEKLGVIKKQFLKVDRRAGSKK